MIVFKNYLKVLKKNLGMFIGFTVLFIGMSLLYVNLGNDPVAEFTSSKPYVSIVNRDKESSLIDHFIEYTEKNAEIIELDDNETVLKDAIFYREVSFIMIIPEGFNDAIKNKELLEIETMSVPDSSSVYLEMLLEKYLNIVDVYANSGMTETEIISNINNVMKKEAFIVIDSEVNVSEFDNVAFFYRFSNYVILYICVYLVGFLMSTFNNSKIKRRNLVSGTSYLKINMELFLGNLVFALSMWLLYVVVSIILFGNIMFTINGLLLILNSLIFTIMSLSIGFMIGSFVRNKEAINGLSNVIALGFSFLCGAFVPQAFLGSNIVNMSKTLPSYYYITNVDIINNLTNYTINNLKPIFINMGILVIYTIGFFLITNIISRLTLKKEN